ncbi:MAG: UDP-N-acetylglucosamine--N-acetylmuramyl-(pentapeptide) pyrophosphoryl-undecaprenol N-acetylglucosamine transferase [Planctomycetota bacterium]
MKVAYLGGGTGGHLAPGVAVAEELRRRGHDALFCIAGRDVERQLLEPRGLSSCALFGDGGRPAFTDLAKWTRAVLRWRRALADYAPDAVVVLGGWVAAPALLTGLRGRPSVLIEQNARAGKVQRLLGGRVDFACLSVAGPGMPRGRRGTRVTGNPLLTDTSLLDRAEAARRLGLAADRRTLLLMGGSQGSSDVNALLPVLLPVLEETGEPWQVLNLTGRQPCPVLERHELPVLRQRFLQDMPAAYALADVAVCRAGGGTVAELAAHGIPSVLVPYPGHRDRHQEANGEILVKVGGALMVEAGDARGQKSAPALLRQVLARRAEMAKAAATAARPAATHDVAEVVLEAVRSRA